MTSKGFLTTVGIIKIRVGQFPKTVSFSQGHEPKDLINFCGFKCWIYQISTGNTALHLLRMLFFEKGNQQNQ